MSSAILYLAIVAIWACVLIPRWLRRGGTAPASTSASAEPSVEVPAEVDDNDLDDDLVETDDEESDESMPAPAPLSADESRRRMLVARRRLLLMLIGLEATAIALAFTGLAALWVVAPPTLMLGGYVLLLREAARADTERAQFEADQVIRARERSRARAGSSLAVPAARDTPAEGTSTEGIPAAAAALAAKFAAAPVPEDYEDAGPGRDFAPGLAGKYTTSDLVSDDEYYDGYQPRLRAVGD